MHAKQQELVNKRVAERVSHANNQKEAEILAITDQDKRDEALYKAGLCTHNYGTCTANKGKIAKAATRRDGKQHNYCEHHRDLLKKPSKKARVTEMPKAKPEPLKNQMRKAAGPKPPKDDGAVMAYMKANKVTYKTARAAVYADKNLNDAAKKS